MRESVHSFRSIPVYGNVFTGVCGVRVVVGAGSVLVGVAGTDVLVGVAGTGVSVGTAVGGTRVGVRVGSGVGVGRLKVRKTRFSAYKSSPFMRYILSVTPFP